MDKEAIEKIAEIVKERTHLIITASHYNQLDDETYTLHALNMAGAILAEIEELGYHKPSGKPPLLSNKKIVREIGQYILVPRPKVTQRDLDVGSIIAQAQREVDIKYYEL